MKSFKDGEPRDHPGCLSHVTHPCDGRGRVAGRGTPRSSAGNETPWERFAREYYAYFPEESSVERQTRELAEHYHDITDEFDVEICGNSRGFPETAEQRRASTQNAKRVSEEFFRCLAPLGVTMTQWRQAIRMAAQRTRNRCRD